MRSLINELRLLTLGRQIFMIKMMIWVFNDASNFCRLIEGLTEFEKINTHKMSMAAGIEMNSKNLH